MPDVDLTTVMAANAVAAGHIYCIGSSTWSGPHVKGSHAQPSCTAIGRDQGWPFDARLRPLREYGEHALRKVTPERDGPVLAAIPSDGLWPGRAKVDLKFFARNLPFVGGP